MKTSASYSRNTGWQQTRDEVGEIKVLRWPWAQGVQGILSWGLGSESSWNLGRRGRIYVLIKGEFTTFYRLLVDVLDYGDSCIILWQATGLPICCMGMLNPPVYPAWKACWEILVVWGYIVTPLKVTGKGCSKSLLWMTLGVKDCDKLSHIVKEKVIQFVCIF